MPLYSLGSNSSYQLSLRHANDVSTPTLTSLSLPPDEYPVKIAAGSNHTLLSTNKGSLYTTGTNKYGQCLRPPCDVISGFTEVDGKWKDCAATWEGSLTLNENGSVRSFGRIRSHRNLAGKGLDEHQESVGNISNGEEEGLECNSDLDGIKGRVPRMAIAHVEGGVQHFVVFGKDGAFCYGDGRKGQFGVTTNATEPVKIPAEDVIQVTCGKDFTCILSPNNTLAVYTTSTKHNLLSVPNCTDIKSIAASWSTIAILHRSGNITSWGRSDRGQLPPPNLPPIAQLAAGSEHFIALSETNQVYAWGWNEHGNCGLDTLEDVTYVHELVFPEDETPMYVAAGCGTSWIWTRKV